MIGIGTRRPGEAADDDVIRPRREVEGISWTQVLVWFMRALSVAWLLKGLGSWASILDMSSSGGVAFEDAPIGLQSAVVYFAVIDILAAVGLWFASIWGGVLWMMAVMSHLILAVFFPRVMSNSALLVAVFIFAIMLYLTFAWLSAVEEA